MLTNKIFTNLGFVNCTVFDEHDLDRTVLVYQYKDETANLIFKKHPNAELWEIWEGRATINKLYAGSHIETEYQLTQLLNLYKARSAMQAEGK